MISVEENVNPLDFYDRTKSYILLETLLFQKINLG